MSDSDPSSDPLPRQKPLGGRAGVAIVSIVPIVAFALFLIFGFTTGGWAWSWLFFLAVPIASILVYGPGSRQRR